MPDLTQSPYSYYYAKGIKPVKLYRFTKPVNNDDEQMSELGEELLLEPRHACMHIQSCPTLLLGYTST